MYNLGYTQNELKKVSQDVLTIKQLSRIINNLDNILENDKLIILNAYKIANIIIDNKIYLAKKCNYNDIINISDSISNSIKNHCKDNFKKYQLDFSKKIKNMISDPRVRVAYLESIQQTQYINNIIKNINMLKRQKNRKLNPTINLNFNNINNEVIKYDNLNNISNTTIHNMLGYLVNSKSNNKQNTNLNNNKVIQQNKNNQINQKNITKLDNKNFVIKKQTKKILCHI